jgi:hypothetical protein
MVGGGIHDERERRGDDGGAARPLGMADHRLGRRSRHAVGEPSEHLPDAPRLDGVVETADVP